jgi:DnaJ-class molecular chaperone
MPDLFVDCPDCGGSGEIRWNPSSVHDPQLEQSAMCSTCRGDGMVSLDEVRGMKRAVPAPAQKEA